MPFPGGSIPTTRTMISNAAHVMISAAPIEISASGEIRPRLRPFDEGG